MSLKTLLALGCAVAAAGAIAGPAAAQSEAQAARDIENLPVSVAVRYGDLDLSSQRGSTQMLSRLSNAALEACGAPSTSVRDYRWDVQRSACYRKGMDHAVADLSAPTVTRLYQQRGVYASN